MFPASDASETPPLSYRSYGEIYRYPMNFLKPRPFIISAPSGTGKTSVLTKAREILPILTFSVSYTTRTPRETEKDGIDYFFISKPKFQKMIKQGEFIEWAEVFGNYYGTSKKFIETSCQRGQIVILDIDVQGTLQIMNQADLGAVYIFITPPSIAELEKRLRNRGTETVKSLQERLSAAEKELSFKNRYDYIIINESLDKAVEQFLSIVLKECIDFDKIKGHGLDRILNKFRDHLGPDPNSELETVLSKLLNSPKFFPRITRSL